MKTVLSAILAVGMVFTFSFFIGCSDDGGGGDGGGGPPPGDGAALEIDSDDIGGTVSSNPPEAGVWVIAETDDLPTKFRKIVVTDENGQFVIPDLPNATYDVWVRGYGLKDSEPVQVTPGNLVELTVEPASTPQEAAKVYPANYWYSLLEPPSEDMFPGTGEEGNGIPESHQVQASWISTIKLSCELCHQVGTQATRFPSAAAFDFGLMKTGFMNNAANSLGRDVALQVFGDWGSNIAAGEVPPQPPRPSTMIERGVVMTQWDWGDGLAYTHDEVATDKRNPTLYPYGKVYGADIGLERLLAVDPVTNEAIEYTVPFLPGFEESQCAAVTPLDCFTLPAYGQISGPHNPMFDDEGRVWLTTGIKPGATEADQPDFCTAGSRGDIPLPVPAGRELAYFDTATEEFVLINTCQRTHHLQFDEEGLLWLSSAGGGRTVYWVDPSELDPNDVAGTESAANNWRDIQFDSDCDGTADTNLAVTGQRVGNGYGIIPNPVDGSIWWSNIGYPGNIGRFDKETEKMEVYLPPVVDPEQPLGEYLGHGSRGIDVDTNGIIWTALGGSGHLAKFDRSKCAQTCGAGDQCPEGWTLYETPGPQFKGVSDGPNEGSADFHYYMWLDQFNTSGLGENWPFVNGTGSDSILAFDPEAEQFHVIRFPYPLAFFQRGLDGRIDDPDAGWKGRGLWIDNGGDPIKHVLENNGVGFIAHVQFRPSPLDH